MTTAMSKQSAIGKIKAINTHFERLGVSDANYPDAGLQAQLCRRNHNYVEIFSSDRQDFGIFELDSLMNDLRRRPEANLEAEHPCNIWSLIEPFEVHFRDYSQPTEPKPTKQPSIAGQVALGIILAVLIMNSLSGLAQLTSDSPKVRELKRLNACLDHSRELGDHSCLNDY